jgi:hypothetical protein
MVGLGSQTPPPSARFEGFVSPMETSLWVLPHPIFV